MTCDEFISEVMSALSKNSVEEIGKSLFPDCIQLRFIEPEDLSVNVISEKLSDYFEKSEILRRGSFNNILKKFMDDIDCLVASRIEKEPIIKDRKAPPCTIRSRKYYERAKEIRKGKLSFSDVVDYSRLMLCLYSSIIDNDYKPIVNFDYNAEALELEILKAAFKSEKNPIDKKKRFNIKNKYGSDQNAYVLMIIMYYVIANNKYEEK